MKFKLRLPEKDWFLLFEIGVILKGLNGIWETLTGFLILFVGKAWFTDLFAEISHEELAKDPKDKLLYIIGTGLNHISESSKLFIGIYILAHGIINLFLAYYLYKKKLGAYLVSIVFLIIFSVYQLYRFTHTHSIILLLITAWDLIFIVVTWHEYKYQRRLTEASEALTDASEG